MLAVGVYLPALQNEFVTWDDHLYLTENEQLTAPLWAFLKWAGFSFYEATWQPLTWLSHRLDYQIWGPNPFGHHLTNILLHAANTFLVTLLTARLVQSARGSEPRASWPSGAELPPGLLVAAVAGLLFALHPIHVESVAWAAERKDLLCAFFFLWVVLLYLREAAGRPGGEDLPLTSGAGSALSRSRAIQLLLFAAALASKPMAVSLPIVLVILDWYPLRRIGRSGLPGLRELASSLVEKIPFLLLCVGSGLLTIAAHQEADAFGSTIGYPLSARVLVALHALLAYLGKLVLPLHLVPFYAFPIEVSLASPDFFLAVLGVAGLTAASLIWGRRQPLWLVCWLIYIVMLSPTLGLAKFGRHAMADRFVYLPGIPLFLLAGLACERLIQGRRYGRRMVLAAVLAAALALLAATTVAQIGVWKDDLSLWSAVCRGNRPTQRIAFAYLNLGDALARDGRPTEAASAFQRGIELDPGEGKAYHNLGNAYIQLGRLEQARIAFEAAIQNGFDKPDPHINLANLYDIEGRKRDAEREFLVALSLDPDSKKAHYNLAVLHESMGRRDAAIDHYRKAVRLDPDYQKARRRLLALLDERETGLH